MLAAVASGASCRATAERFDVSASSVIKLVRRWRRSGDYAPVKPGDGRKRKLAGHEDWLHAVMREQPDITLAELQGRLAAEKAVAISLQAINETLSSGR